MTSNAPKSPLKDDTESRGLEMLERNMGQLLLRAMADSQTVEVMVNPDGSVFQEKLGGVMIKIGTIEASRTQAIIECIAGMLGKVVKPESPLLEGELPLDGSRFAGQLPPVVSAPCFAIRKKASSIFPLSDYVERGIMTEEQATLLRTAAADHRNILIAGGTGSGKTTLLNSILREFETANKTERYIIIQDTAEIQCTAPNLLFYFTSLEVNMTMLLKTSLRMRPCRILVGEVRGPEALDLLMAWNTGHEGGAATLHANNAAAALTRLATLVSMHKDAPRNIEPLIADAVHVLVHIARTKDGSRKVHEILTVTGFSDGKFQTARLTSTSH